MDGFDPIAVVEASYTASSDPSWVDRVIDTIRPAIGRDCGITSYLFKASDLRPHGFRSHGPGGEEIAAFIRAGAERSERRDAVAATTMLGLFSSAEVFGPVTYPPELGLRDSLALCFVDGEGSYRVVVSGSPRTEAISSDLRRTFRQLAIHLGAGARLGRMLDSLDDDGIEAVLTPAGHPVHLTASAQSNTAKETLRTAVRAIDRARSRAGRATPEVALDLWRGLVAGRWSLVDHFDSDGRRFVVARRNDPAATEVPGMLTRRERQVAFYAALGLSHKEIAYALGLATSTSASNLRRALDKLGLASRIELIALAAQMSSAGRAHG